jgi:fructokinase
LSIVSDRLPPVFSLSYLSVPLIPRAWTRTSCLSTSRILPLSSEARKESPIPLMNTEFYAFGEILWDCLPSGRHAGGAPFSVAAHLVQLGASASLIPAVGRDSLGDEILKVAEEKGVNTQFVTRARIGLATGTVLVTVDDNGNATYELVQPVAWDEIKVLPEALEAVAQARGLIFGSLAGRSPYNLDQLNRLLAIEGPMKFFDVNLRPPFADPVLVIDLAQRVDVIKLNDDEVGKLASWLKTGEATLNTPRSPDALAEACAALAKATNTSRICVTRAAEGAALWENGNLLCARAPQLPSKTQSARATHSWPASWSA